MQGWHGSFMQAPRMVVQSRRALADAPVLRYRRSSGLNQLVAASPVADGGGAGSSFDANVVMVLAVLLCALICALGLNSIVRCALRCSSRASAEQDLSSVARLAQTGLRRKALRGMPTLVYSAGLRLHAAGTVCAICLSDFEPGERVRVLPKCSHGFHVRCVDRWLLTRSTCPTCRQSLFAAPPKASGCTAASQAEQVPVRSVLVPLRPEGMATPYDF